MQKTGDAVADFEIDNLRRHGDEQSINWKQYSTEK